MKTKHRILLLVFALMSLANGLRAQDSLQAYLQVASEKNSELMSNFQSYQAALERIPQAGAYADPQVELGVFLSPMSLLNGKQVADIKVMQLFPWFGVQAAQQNEAMHRAKKSFNQFQEVRNGVFLKVYEQWYGLCSLKQQLIAAKKNLELLQQVEALALTKYSGSTSSGMSEVLRVQMEEVEIQNTMESLQLQWGSREAQLNALLNRPLHSSISIPDSLEALHYGLLEDTAMGKIQNENPKLRMLQEESLAIQSKLVSDRKKSYPMLGIGVDYMLMQARSNPQMASMNGKDMIMPMFTTTIPLFRKKYKAQQREDRLMIQANEEQYAGTLSQLQADYIQAKQGLEEFAQKLSRYQKQAALAKTTFTLMLQEFAANQVALTDLIQVNKQLNDYEMKESMAIANYNIQVAKLNLLMNKNVLK